MNALLEWTEKAEKRGLDPLGMQASGIALYQSLLPGISNVTLRMHIIARRALGPSDLNSESFSEIRNGLDATLSKRLAIGAALKLEHVVGPSAKGPTGETLSDHFGLAVSLRNIG